MSSDIAIHILKKNRHSSQAKRSFAQRWNPIDIKRISSPRIKYCFKVKQQSVNLKSYYHYRLDPTSRLRLQLRRGWDACPGFSPGTTL